MCLIESLVASCTTVNQLSDESFRARSENGYAKHPLLYFAFQWFLGQGMDHKPDLFLKSGDPMVFGHLIEQLRLANGQKVFDEPIVDNLRVGPQPVGGTVFWYPLMWVVYAFLALCPFLPVGGWVVGYMPPCLSHLGSFSVCCRFSWAICT